ncbi:MFS transporter PfmaC [Exophiala dermatitidis]
MSKQPVPSIMGKDLQSSEPFTVADPARRAQPRPPIRRWFQWYEPGISKAEKRLVFKSDCFILTYTCLTFFVKYLDQTNVTNAYVSGMQTDLHLNGNELNWFTTYFNIGIIVGAPFTTSVLTFINPRWWLPFCTTIWSFFVLFIYKAQLAKTIYILRFFAGLWESGAMPGAFYIIGSWYRKSEISRRTTLFWFASVGGQMLSGYIQAGLYRNMNHRLGLAAWRWLFILDFIIGIPVVVFGLFCCPDEPKSPKMWWMTEEEKEISIKRISEEGRDADMTSWRLADLKEILSSWQFYGFVLAWGFMELTCGVNLQRWMTLYIRSLKVDGHAKYSVEKINAIPTVVGCTGLVWMLASSFIADNFQCIPLMIVVLGCVQLFGYISLLVWSTNEAFMLSVYYLTSAYSAISPLISSWLNSSCGGNKHLRAVSTAMMISVGYAVETVAQQEMFPTSQAPRFRQTHGYIFGVVAVVCMIVWSGIILPMIERHFTRRERTLYQQDENPSATPSQSESRKLDRR